MTQKDAMGAGDEGISTSDGRAEFAEVLTVVEAEATPGRLLEAARALQGALDEKRLAETSEFVADGILTDSPHA
ncbi:hypothetical protein [Mesorhizobium sp. CAU 1732]|uniref:hypothetical protein n=1 Tax=Mesorhizobium sp. CAU 1732 TaxID=3140358 RepID=UPI0032600582